MGLLDPEEVCCGLSEKPPSATERQKQPAPRNTNSDAISQSDRIEKLEIQMARLSQDIETIKNQQCNAATAIQRAINCGVCGLGGRFRLLNDVCVPSYTATSKNKGSSGSSCCSNSSTTSSSIRGANPKNNAYTPVGEKEKKLNEDKNGCAEFVLG